MPITFGKVSPGDFTLPKSNVIDGNTSAAIIADVGNISFVGNKDNNWVSYVFKKNTRIKIINKKAFDLATITIQLSGIGKHKDRIDDLQASTYNLENAKVIETTLNLADVFRDSINKNHVEEKFSLPGIKEGCIIEYSYTITSYQYWNLPSWTFQHSQYPCLYSQYQTSIPNMLGFLTVYHGADSFVVNKSETTKELYKMATVNVTAEIKKHKWAMKDIPPFNKELYLYNPYDYKDKIEFHLLQTYNGDDISGIINWSSATKELLSDNEFGAAISVENSTNLTNTVERISTSDVDYMDAAKHIYSYIRDNFVCIEDNDIFLGNDLYAIDKKKKGSVEELNLLLVALLRQKRINASPVILSTSGYGINPSGYPVLSKMNYVVCMMKMAGDTTFLDATRPFLGFGKLPLDCYNGHARIIGEHDSGSVFLYRDAIKEQKSTTVFLVNDEKGNGAMSGSFESTPGYFESYDIRNKISKIGEKDFFKDVQQSYGSDIKIENTGIDSLNHLEDPVKVHYDFNFKTDNGQDIIYYNPIIQSSFKENPFKAAERKYPIEMPYPIDEIYVLNMEIPAGYVVDELPKSSKVAYNANEGFFEYLIQKSETNVQLRTHIKLNKATFAAEDYNSLRDFFAYVVKKQEEQIVFKKKK